MTPADLRAARKALGLSVEGLAALIGVEGRTVRRWEDGTRDISRTAIILLDLMRSEQSVRRRMGLDNRAPVE